MTMPSIHAMAIVLEPTDSLLEHPRNARQGDVGAICESIRVNGYMAPVIVQTSTRHVIDGNHRLQAARSLGMLEVPTIWVDVDDETALRYLLAANRTNDLAAYDDHALIELLAELTNQTTAGLAGTGYEAEDLAALIADVQTPPPLELPPTPPPDPLTGNTEHRCPSCGHEWAGSCTPHPIG